MTTIETGKLFKIECSVEGFGFCGNDTHPTAGKPLICAENYSLVIATEEDCDQDGNLLLTEGIQHGDVHTEYVDKEIGWSDGDGTARILLTQKNGEWEYNDVFEVTV